MAPGYVRPFNPIFPYLHLSPRYTVFLARNIKESFRMKLTVCPNEVHHHSLAHISHLNNLINITLVSHHFRHFTELLLYRTIYFKVPSMTKELVDLESSNQSLDDTLYSFQIPIRLLETLTAHPDLGCKIGKLSLAFQSETSGLTVPTFLPRSEDQLNYQ